MAMTFTMKFTSLPFVWRIRFYQTNRNSDTYLGTNILQQALEMLAEIIQIYNEAMTKSNL